MAKKKRPAQKKVAKRKVAKKKVAKRTSRGRGSILVPSDVLKFLRANENREFQFDRAQNPQMEIDTVKFVAPRALKLSKFSLNTHEYYLNHGEAGDDPDLWYDIEGVDLVAECGGYDADGILIWFPQFQEFGFSDPDHATVSLFPQVAWKNIESDLPNYLNAQWWSDVPTLLRPWSDPRCQGIKPSGEG